MFPALFILCVGTAMMVEMLFISISSGSPNIFYTMRPLYKLGYLVWALGNLLIGFTLLGFYS